MKKIKDEKLLGLYSQGLTNREIADRLQVTQPAVHYRLQKLGLQNNCRKDKVVDPEKVELLYRCGLTTVGMALLLETSVYVIAEHMRKMGLKDNYDKLRKIVSSTL